MLTKSQNNVYFCQLLTRITTLVTMVQLFGQRIKTLRTENGFTLAQLSAQIGVHSANLSKMENGKREFDEKKIELLAKIFNLKPEDLKTEYYGEYIAKKICKANCSIDALTVAETKLEYLRQQDKKQAK